MEETEVSIGSLVLYKRRPALVVRIGDKIHIELQGGNCAKVRPKDVILLHPGPLASLDELLPQDGEIVPAWDILRESESKSVNLIDLSELIYGQHTPATAWAAWNIIEDGLYFRGTPSSVIPCTPDEVESEQIARQDRLAKELAWQDFIKRARANRIDPDLDASYLREVEDLALGRQKTSRVLRELGRSERPENAHAFLLQCGYWDFSVVPYPYRLNLSLVAPEAEVPPPPKEERLDLTHLATFAIDDYANQDPDDAISLEAFNFDHQGEFVSGRVWIHVADAACLAPPNSPIDVDACARGATLYLPDGAVHMLPLQAIQYLGLGLQEVSPALSFCLELNASGEIIETKITPSWVRVERLSYSAAEKRLEESPFRELDIIAQAYQDRRRNNGALFIDLPEVIINVIERQVTIRPVLHLRSRDLVREAMLMTGEAAARYATENNLPFPFATQSPPDLDILAELGFPISDKRKDHDLEPFNSLAFQTNLRRALKRSQISSIPTPHAGVGLPVYSRATSPLRRYLDLVVHQQLRAHLQGKATLTENEMFNRLGVLESIVGNIQQAEALARRHWTLVYLTQNPGWQGQGVLVEKLGLRGRVIIPEIALETPLNLNYDLPLDSQFPVRLLGVNLPDLEAHFEQI